MEINFNAHLLMEKLIKHKVAPINGTVDHKLEVYSMVGLRMEDHRKVM
jgi:hypothetical protein